VRREVAYTALADHPASNWPSARCSSSPRCPKIIDPPSFAHMIYNYRIVPAKLINVNGADHAVGGAAGPAWR